MGRIGDIADLVTGLALLGGGYLVYKAVKEAGDIIPEFPTFEWPEFPGWPELPGVITPPAAGGETTGYDALLDWLSNGADIPGIGEGEGIGGGGGGVRNGGAIIPEIPADYLDAIMRGGGIPTRAPTWEAGDLTKGLGRIFQINGDLFGFRKAPGLEFGTRREARRYLKAYGGDLL